MIVRYKDKKDLGKKEEVKQQKQQIEDFIRAFKQEKRFASTIVAENKEPAKAAQTDFYPEGLLPLQDFPGTRVRDIRLRAYRV